MRKAFAALTTVALASLGALVPATSAQAADCSDAMSGALSGYMYAYDSTNCAGHLGHASGDDSNWGDSALSFQGGDANKASSILNNGNSYEVKFYNGTGHSGGHICLSRSEGWASSLSNDTYSTGVSANNSISSHAWASASNCSKWAV
ncbi:MAG TPA: peptidase inhibitor family I36 protein [Streptomyces sp.]|uniref:peptidase inhibitor family I36 protein n=1 Tax=Streptomyces sp. TaxID=1931 RepID=UPI002B77D04B|nr:peptidase inhibitor family I36 protein [Streptomyces sp.]HWU08207.1 peptidase inhibitor family I36 protein [Streptomyces sp.]